MDRKTMLLIGLVVLAAATRLVPHPPNVTPIAAMALFGGAFFAHRALGVLVPLAAMFLSDLVIGLHGQMGTVYLSFVLVSGIGFLLRGRTGALPVMAAALAASVLFFLVTNFGVWLTDGLYPPDLSGLLACYVAAIPFFGNTLAGNLLFTALLFGAWALADRRHAGRLAGPA